MTTTLGDPARHFFMTRSVARVMGLSLSEAMQNGHLDPAEYSNMGTRCRGCALVEACQEWLSTGTAPRRTAPPGCWNGETLQRLAGAMA